MIEYKVGDYVELKDDTYFCGECLPKGTRGVVISVAKKSWIDDTSCFISIEKDFYVQGVNVRNRLGVMMSEIKFVEVGKVMRVKCICKECIEYGLVGTVISYERGSAIVKWNSGDESVMYIDEIEEVEE